MIVEIEELKPVISKDNSKESKPLEKSITRVLLRPNSETLFADLCLLNQKSGNKWTDKEAFEIEAKILVRSLFLFLKYPSSLPPCGVCDVLTQGFVSQLATAPPLCLDPDPRLGKIANSLYRISLPRTPPPLRPKKRKANGLESTEEDEASWNRKAKIIRFMDPKPTRSATPSYALLCYAFSSTAIPNITVHSKVSVA
jgi:transcription factor SPT20